MRFCLLNVFPAYKINRIVIIKIVSHWGKNEKKTQVNYPDADDVCYRYVFEKIMFPVYA